MKYLFLLFVSSCGFDNFTSTHTLFFTFPQDHGVDNLKLSFWPENWIEELEKENGIDVTDAEYSRLDAFELSSREEDKLIDFIESIDVYLGSNEHTEIKMAWADNIKPTANIDLIVNPDIELLTYAHAYGTYVRTNFHGVAPKNDLDVAAKISIYTETTWGMACSMSKL